MVLKDEEIEMVSTNKYRLAYSKLENKNNIEEKKETFTKKNLLFTVDNPIIEKILSKKNIAGHCMVDNTIYDKRLILHSEKNSADLEKYEKNGFVGIYYWSHAFIALDWYRFAKHDKSIDYPSIKSFDKDFNIYCRDWTGSREYRLSLLSKIKKNKIDKKSYIFFNEYSNGVHFSDYNTQNNLWKLNEKEKKVLDDLECIKNGNTDPALSSVYNPENYKNSAIDIVLETIFDKEKVQLTEKILRPIACQKPFILVSEKKSLEYLQSYGFKTFGHLIDESYDSIECPKKRLDAITQTMVHIASLSKPEKEKLFFEMHEIAKFNKKWFFSKKFFNIVNDELKNNLTAAFNMLDDPKYQTAKEPMLFYRGYKKYYSYFTGKAKKHADSVLTEYPERIALSKKNIGIS